MVISFMTRAELRFGARKAGWGSGRMSALEAHIARYAICFPDAAMCDLWADVTLEAAQQGHSDWFSGRLDCGHCCLPERSFGH